MLQRQPRPMSADGIALLFVVFVVMYFQSLGVLNLNADDDLALFRTDPSVWIKQGRWGAYLVERFLLPLPAIPYLPLATFGAGLCLSFAMIATSLSVQKVTWPLLLAFALFVGVPQWIFIMDYSANLVSVGIGFACASASALVFLKSAENHQAVLKRLISASPSVVLLCLATSFYEALFVVGLLLSSAVIMWRCATANMSIKDALAMQVVILAFGACGFGLYSLINEASISALQIERRTLAGWITNPLQWFDNFWPSWAYAMDTFGSVVWGQDDYYGTPIFAFALATLAASAVPVLVAFSNGLSRGMLVALWVAAAWLAVVAFQLFAGGFVTPRTMMQFPALVAVLAIVALSLRWKAAKICLLALFALAVFQESIVINRAAASRELIATRDASIAGDLFWRIALVGKPGPRGTYSIATLGIIKPQLVYPMPPGARTALSYFARKSGNAIKAVLYMRSLGYPVTMGGKAEKYTKQWASMPLWPAEGSVAAFGEITLIKLSDAPGCDGSGRKPSRGC